MKTKSELTLPEWAFLEATSHLGNELKGRTILQHMRSYTMVEIIDTDEVEVQLKPEVKSRKFVHRNKFGVDENLLIAVHFTLAEFEDLDEVLDKAIAFYCEYSNWEDGNIIDEDKSKQN